jgi:hypothetical protein
MSPAATYPELMRREVAELRLTARIEVATARPMQQESENDDN